MTSNFRKKTSSTLVSILIGLIIISFMFTGFESMQGSSDTVATIGGKAIKYREFNQEYERQIQFYGQMMGGRSLTSKQIKQWGIRSKVLERLASMKLSLIFSEKMGVVPGPMEIKEEIKSLPYFKDGDKFNLAKYNQLLAANGIAPSEFEKDIKNSLYLRAMPKILEGFPVPKNYAEDILNFRKTRYSAQVVQIKKDDLVKHIDVPRSKIDGYLAEDKNLKSVQELFKKRKASLDTKEQVKARHILLKVGEKKDEAKVKKRIESLHKTLTVSNFISKANKLTEDPSGKGKGGSLGWFSRGRMVPPFEKVAFSQKPGTISKPVKTNFGYHIIYVEKKKAKVEAKFDNHKRELAKEEIQKNDKKGLDSLHKKLATDIEGFLKSGNLKRVETLRKTYGFRYEKDGRINRLDGLSGGVKLQDEDLKKVFKGNHQGLKTFVFDDVLNVSILAISKAKPENKKKKTGKDKKATPLEEVQQELVGKVGQELQREVMKSLQDKMKLKVVNKAVL